MNNYVIVTWYIWNEDTKRYIQNEKTKIVELPPGDKWTHHSINVQPEPETDDAP